MHSKTPPLLIILCLLLASCAGLGLRSNAQLAFEQGLAQFNQGHYAEAIPHFITATERDPEFAQAYLYLGRSYLNLSRWFDAIPALRTALQLAPEATQKEVAQLLFDALLGAATSRLKQGNVQQAIPLFRQSIELAPQSQQAQQGLLNALLTLGGELLSQGKIPDAVATYTEVTQLAPQNFEAYLGLARALLQQGDLIKALTAARHALHLAPNNGEALSLLQQMQRR